MSTMTAIGQTWNNIAKQWKDIDNSANVVYDNESAVIEVNANWLYHSSGTKRISVSGERRWKGEDEALTSSEDIVYY